MGLTSVYHVYHVSYFFFTFELYMWMFVALITIFRSIAMFCGTDNIHWHVVSPIKHCYGSKECHALDSANNRRLIVRAGDSHVI